MVAAGAAVGAAVVAAGWAAGAVTEVAALAELFAGLGSAVVELADAVFVTVVPALATLDCTTSVKVAEAAAESEALVQVTAPVPPTAGVAQVNTGPDVCARDTNVVPAGRVSVNAVDCAAWGPLLVRPME